jgi:hypothetical protein
MGLFPRPWSVLIGARSNPVKAIVEVIDATRTLAVLPWEGFDATGRSHDEQKLLAQVIVNAVNESR